MNWPYEWQLGWRYTRAGRVGRRNRFISFISAVSMLGIALGVAALIIVLSVMNGFQKEVRDRMLSVISHVEVSDASGAALADWRRTASEARRNPQVIGAAPFVASQALIARGDDMRGIVVRGIVPQEEVTVILPGGQVTPAGIVPRLRSLTVVGTFDAGHYEYDSGLALVALEDAAKLFRVDGPTGIQLRLKDLDRAPLVAAELANSLGPQVLVRDWTSTNRNWF